MKLDDDAMIDLLNEDDYSTIERSGKSLIGRLLNPECQNMACMLRSMPRIWKIYDRVKGIALTRESFQFIFDLESDIQTVMKHGILDFDDWGVVMDRWIEKPPANFLKTARCKFGFTRFRSITVLSKLLKRLQTKLGKLM
ncbi:uncharacterized protein LOC112086505 [Eutrema salsugineum]|uniref:uncharacterized protein LOC112086505 n=1 Tax=Eutrema salsugineum TaxID=72664 RepID=UPI000CED04AF|nr:uncharacterized protein LOC112086505 [Eutrema salsugineum]